MTHPRKHDDELSQSPREPIWFAYGLARSAIGFSLQRDSRHAESGYGGDGQPRVSAHYDELLKEAQFGGGMDPQPERG